MTQFTDLDGYLRNYDHHKQLRTPIPSSFSSSQRTRTPAARDETPGAAGRDAAREIEATEESLRPRTIARILTVLGDRQRQAAAKAGDQN